MKRTYFAMGLVLLFFSPPPVKAQEKSLKTNPTVFYRETFNWGNPADAKGWTAPPGFVIADALDNGYTWHWWPDDSMNCSWMTEPPFRSSSRADGHLTLFAALYNNYRSLSDLKPISSSITFPAIDCSAHSSVIIEFETNFVNRGYQGTLYGMWQCLVEISPDNGIHWNQFNAGFGNRGGSRPNDIGPGETTLFRENITGFAAGLPMVKIRITWNSSFGLYFWNIDDLKLTEAAPNDLRLDKIDIQWDDKDPTTTETVSYSLPVCQIGSGRSFEKFKSWVTNMGSNEATNIVFDVTIRKNDVPVFTESRVIESIYPGYIDSASLSGSYEPREKGNYSITYSWKQKEGDDFPVDNQKTIFFEVTDSVYNRAGNTPDYSYSFASLNYVRDVWDLEANVNHLMGSIFPIYNDCELDGISAYIMGGLADGLIDFGFTVIDVKVQNLVTSYRNLMKTDRLYLDSTMFYTWVYLPFTKDGESEFIKGGSMLYAGVQYSNWHNTEALRRDKGLSIGGNHQVPIHDAPSVGGKPWPTVQGGFQYPTYTTKNLMVRLYMHDKSSSADPAFPGDFSVSQNFPNPFSYHTTVNYSIAQEARVRLEITDLTGRMVFIKDEGLLPNGSHRMKIQNPGLAPGIYFYTLYAGEDRQTKKMIVADQ